MQNTERRRLCLYTALIIFAQLPAGEAPAQGYPNKPVSLLVGSTAGGGSDTIARLLAQKLPQFLGQPMVVENRLGAAGAIATERVARSLADGYTLLMLSSDPVISSTLRADLPFDLERDFAAVSLVATAPFVLGVKSSVPVRDVKELIALAGSRPGTLTYGSSGIGSTPHLGVELFSLMAKVKLVHVPFKGGVEVTAAVAGGQIDMSFNGITSSKSLLAAGKLRPLAVTSMKRSSLLPSIPTLDESGLSGYDYFVWYGVTAPAAVPKDIIARLNSAINKVVNTPEMKETFDKQGIEPQTDTPEQFGAFISSELARFAKLVKLAGMKAE